MSNLSLIINNIRSGFIIVQPDLRLEIVPSKATQSILGAAANADVTLETLFPLSGDRGMMFRMGVEQFFENFMPPEVTLAMLPAETNISGRIVGISYTPVTAGSDAPSALIIEVTDITHEETERRLKELEGERNEMLLRVLREKEGFLTFLKDTEQDLEKLESCDHVPEGKRILHTLKGNSSAFGLADIAARIHEIEDEADTQISLDGSRTFFTNSAHEVSAMFDSFLVDHFAVLGISRQDSDSGTFHISERELFEIERQLTYIEQGDLKENLSRKLVAVRTKPCSVFLSTFDAVVARLSENLGKEISFKLEGGNIRVCPQSVGSVLRELIHIIRNCCDHGIESPEVREQAGKSSCGQILLYIREISGERVEITIEDDGRGIDTDRLTAAAVRKGHITEGQAAALTEAGKLALLFLDGVSTAGKVTAVSGRGVGMAALRHQIANAGGTIDVATVPGQSSAFRITMPQFSSMKVTSRKQAEIIKWNASLSIGVEEMDLQHQKLIAYLSTLQKLQNAWEEGESVELSQVKAVLTDLTNYTVYHFENEEKLLLQHDYPDFDAHKQLHTKLLAQVGQIVGEFDRTGPDALPRITSFLSNWLRGHILGTDRKYAQHINEAGIEWHDELSVGIDDMDRQHQVLIDYINEFRQLARLAAGGQLDSLKPVALLLDKLTDYTIMHFKEEEQLLESHQYPDLENHKRLHAALIRQVRSFHEKFTEDPIRVIPALTSFLSRWLLQHILGNDKKYGIYISHKDSQAG